MQRSENESTRAQKRPGPLRAQEQSSESQFRGSVRETRQLCQNRIQTEPLRAKAGANTRLVKAKTGPEQTQCRTKTGPKQVRVRTSLWSLARGGRGLAGPKRNFAESPHSCHEWSNVEPVLKSLERGAMAWESPPVQSTPLGQGSGAEMVLLDAQGSPAVSHSTWGCLQ